MSSPNASRPGYVGGGRWKPAVHHTDPLGRAWSAYLHGFGDRKWPFPTAVRVWTVFHRLPGLSGNCGEGTYGGSGCLAGEVPFLPELGGRFRGGTRAARGLPGLPRSAGASACPGHDDRLGVLPPAGDAAAQSMRAVRAAPGSQGRWRLAADWQEPAAVVPHLVSSAAVRRPDRRVTMATWETGRRVQVAVSASSPSSARMWQAWRRILRASEIAARLPSLRSFTAA